MRVLQIYLEYWNSNSPPPTPTLSIFLMYLGINYNIPNVNMMTELVCLY